MGAERGEVEEEERKKRLGSTPESLCAASGREVSQHRPLLARARHCVTQLSPMS